MMEKFYAASVAVCLLFALVGGIGLENQLSLDSENEQGVKMCPEWTCPPIQVPLKDYSAVAKNDLSENIFPDCWSLSAQAHLTSCTSYEEELGVDKCPERRSVPAHIPSTGFQSHEEKSDVDIGLECRSFPAHSLPAQTTSTNCNLQEEELGVDNRPDCNSLPPQVPSAVYDLHDADPTEDVCPERRQPPSFADSDFVCPSQKDAATLVKKLQLLVKVQQLQINQVAHLLQQLGKSRSYIEQEVLNLPEEQTVESKNLNAKIMDQFAGQLLGEEMTSAELTKAREQKSVKTESNQNSASTKVENGVQLVNGDSRSRGTGSMTVARYRPAWSEHFSFLSAVKVDGEISCLHALPQEGEAGISRYVAVGDMTGRLYIFMWLGDLLLDYPTMSTSPITAMLSYTLMKNETILVTGHADGGVLVHQVWESVDQRSFSGDGSPTPSSIETLHALISPSPCKLRANVKDPQDLHHCNDISTKQTDDLKFADEEIVPIFSGTQSISNLEMYKVGKMRYTLVADMAGKIQLFRDNGSLYGVGQSPSRPLAFMRSPYAQRLVFLTEAGVGSLDLRNMLVHSSICGGLNGSKMMAFAFDITGRSKAHGVTADGELVSVALTGDILHFECHVKRKRKVEVAGPFAPLALRGYLLAATPDHVLGFNTTLQTGLSYASFWVAGPRPIFSVTMTEIANSFLKTPKLRSRWPLMATNREKLLVVGFGHGYVGIFRSNLPTIKPADFSAKFWNSSILISALVMLALWQVFTRRREPGVLVNPEHHPVTSNASAYRKVEDDRLGFEERGKTVEPRRFKSPTRGYVSSGNPKSFGTGSRNFRPTTVDSDTYLSRREPLFASNQPVEGLELLQ